MNSRQTLRLLLLAGVLFYLHGLADLLLRADATTFGANLLEATRIVLFICAVGWCAIQEPGARWYFGTLWKVGLAFFGGGLLLPFLTVTLLYGALPPVWLGFGNALALSALVLGLFLALTGMVGIWVRRIRHQPATSL